MSIAMKLAVSSEPLEDFQDLFQSLAEIEYDRAKSLCNSSEFSFSELSDFGSTTISDFGSQDLSGFSSQEVSDYDSEEDKVEYSLTDFSSDELADFSSHKQSNSISKELSSVSSQELKEYASQKLGDQSFQEVNESSNIVPKSIQCLNHHKNAYMEMMDPDVEKYRWAIEDQKDWFKFNLDPFYPFYAVLEPPLPQASINLFASKIKEVVEINNNHFEETEGKVPEGIRSILKMLRDFDEEESRNF